MGFVPTVCMAGRENVPSRGKQVLRFPAEKSEVANSDEGSGAELKRKQ